MNFTMRQRQHHNPGMYRLRGGLTFSEEEKSKLDPEANYWRACADGAYYRLKKELGESAYTDFATRAFGNRTEDYTYKQLADGLESALVMVINHEEVDAIILSEVASKAMGEPIYGGSDV